MDEQFVKENLSGLTQKDRTLMEKFVEQSLEETNAEGGKSKEQSAEALLATSQTRVKKALFRISGPRETECDDSPLFRGIFDEEKPSCDFSGRLVATDGKRATKLTKIFKRRDNKERLYDELSRMQLG